MSAQGPHPDPMKPAAHPACDTNEQLMANCAVKRLRGSGPGGQHRNKVETGVVITHQPTGVRAEATERRSQHENQVVAVRRLRIRLAVTIRTAVDKPPSPLWSQRCSGGRIAVNPRHADFPALLAESMNRLYQHRWQPGPAAQELSVSTSQLIKLIKLEPEAIQYVNSERQKLSLHSLR